MKENANVQEGKYHAGAADQSATTTHWQFFGLKVAQIRVF